MSEGSFRAGLWLKTAEVKEKEHAHCSDTLCEQWETEPKEVLCIAG